MKALAAIAIVTFAMGYSVGWATAKAHEIDAIIPIFPHWLRRLL